MRRRGRFRPITREEAARMGEPTHREIPGPIHPTDEKFIGDLEYHCPHCDCVRYEGMNAAWLEKIGAVHKCWNCGKTSAPPCGALGREHSTRVSALTPARRLCQGLAVW